MLRYAVEMKARTIPWKLIEALLGELDKDRQWLQSELDVQSNTVTNWRTRGVPQSYAGALGVLLGTNADYLLGVKGATRYGRDVAPHRPMPAPPTEAQIGEWILLFMKMPPETREDSLASARATVAAEDSQKKQGAK